MKYTLTFLFVSLLFTKGYSVETRIIDGVPQTPKYTLYGQTVWDDKEKQRIIDNAPIDTGTGTIKSSDFLVVVVDATDQKIMDEIKSEGKVKTKSVLDFELNKRKSVDYNLEKMQEEKNKIDFYKGLNLSTATYQDSYGKYETRYNRVK